MFLVVLLAFIGISGCQKDFHFKNTDYTPKQVIIANFTVNLPLEVNISKSKAVEDFTPIEFLDDCEVDLYENNIFIERMHYQLFDTLAHLGKYVSDYKLKQDKTYYIVSKHPELGTASASEYLPKVVPFYVSLANHADSDRTKTTAQITLTFHDSAQFANLYYVAVLYRVLYLDTVNGVISNRDEWNLNIPLKSNLYRNPFNLNLIFFNDDLFDGYFHNLTFTFPSTYIKKAYQIQLLVEFTAIGKNYYDMFSQQLNLEENDFNQGSNEPLNNISNIENGYGHFSSYNKNYKVFQIK